MSPIHELGLLHEKAFSSACFHLWTQNRQSLSDLRPRQKEGSLLCLNCLRPSRPHLTWNVPSGRVCLWEDIAFSLPRPLVREVLCGLSRAASLSAFSCLLSSRRKGPEGQ